jgi:uncharacterized membrane protein
MYSAHYHLLLNHLPIIGTFIGLALFLVSLSANKDDLKQASLGLFSFIALLAIPAYMSGNAAQEFFRETPKVSMDLIQTHQGAALLALVFMEITGAIALIGLWEFSRAGKKSEASRPAGWIVASVLLFSIVTSVLMAIAGNTGGEIRHPEIIVGNEAPSSVGAAGAKVVPFVQYYVVEYSNWIWPILEDLHFIGLILILGAIGVLNLRILGFLKQLPVAPLHRFIPWGIAGVFINVITGILFFIGMPPFYADNPDFRWKMVAIVIAGTNLVLFYCSSAFRPLARLGPGDDAPLSAKFIAASSLLLWIAIVFLGRYIPSFEVYHH